MYVELPGARARNWNSGVVPEAHVAPAVSVTVFPDTLGVSVAAVHTLPTRG
jgi:hypothetical protein